VTIGEPAPGTPPHHAVEIVGLAPPVILQHGEFAGRRRRWIPRATAMKGNERASSCRVDRWRRADWALGYVFAFAQAAEHRKGAFPPTELGYDSRYRIKAPTGSWYR